MKITHIETTIVNVPYRQREVSSVVARDGVTDVLVKVTTDDGLVGWGESPSGADAESVAQAIQAMSELTVGRDPFNMEAIRADVYGRGLWHMRTMTANFAWAGIDMALWDIVGKATGQPLYRLFGGLYRDSVDYFYYLTRGTPDSLAAQCKEGLAAGYSVYYLKVGLDFADDLAMVAAVRDALGETPKLRIDANGAWTVAEARRYLAALDAYDIDFAEQPVRDHPVSQMAELRQLTPVPLAANEGLWSEADTYMRLKQRAADVLCFSPYWTGSMTSFHRLAWMAHYEGMRVCKHTHGELGITAAACQHLMLTLPNTTDGNQQTAQHMTEDVIIETLPINTSPTWGVPEGTGLGVSVDLDKVAKAAANYVRDGQFLPYQKDM